MARSESVISRRRVVVRQSYYWPDLQLNLWIILMLGTGGVLVGVFSQFIAIQNQLQLGIPWILPYGVTVGALTIVFILVQLLLIFNRRLLPGVVILGSFILLVLYITGLVETALQLFGSQGDLSGNCNLYIQNNQVTGLSINTFAWLEQNSICQSWDAVFAFWIIGSVVLVWMIILSTMVARGGVGQP